MSIPDNWIVNTIKWIDSTEWGIVKNPFFYTVNAYSWAFQNVKNKTNTTNLDEENCATGAMVTTLGMLSVSFLALSYVTHGYASYQVRSSLLKGADWFGSGLLFWVVSNGIQSMQEARRLQNPPCKQPAQEEQTVAPPPAAQEAQGAAQSETANDRQEPSPSANPKKMENAPNALAKTMLWVDQNFPGFITNPIKFVEHTYSYSMDKKGNTINPKDSYAIGAMIFAAIPILATHILCAKVVNYFNLKWTKVGIMKGVDWTLLTATTRVVFYGLESIQGVRSNAETSCTSSPTPSPLGTPPDSRRESVVQS